MSDWLDDLLILTSGNCSADGTSQQRASQACVLITVAGTRGSCPRDTGTRMVVAADGCRGTIGGGHLEYQAIGIAHEMLSHATPASRVERFPLGARLGQCCGGIAHLSFEFIPVQTPPWIAALRDIRHRGEAAIMVSPADGSDGRLIVTGQSATGSLADSHQQQLAVDHASTLLNTSTHVETIQEGALLYEPLNNTSLQVAIFGAGHVGKALVNVLSTLPCRIHWIDSRSSEFPAQVSSNVRIEHADQPESEVDELPSGTHVVIMTHSHALDQAICEGVLRRDDLAWCGLIGSMTKRRQFEKRLLARGLAPSALAKLNCPIGIDGICGKHPAQIAISVAAQIQLFADAQPRIAVPDHQAA